MSEYQTQLAHLMLFAQSIGIGFLIGLERERHHNTIAGVRTFTLIALAGALAGVGGRGVEAVAGLRDRPHRARRRRRART